MKATLLNILALLVTTASLAQTFTVNGIDYQVTSTNPNEVGINQFDSTITDLVIPTTVTNAGVSFAVTNINDALENFTLSGLNSITTSNPQPLNIGTNSQKARANIDLTIPDGDAIRTAYENAGWTLFKSVNGEQTTFEIDNVTYSITSLSERRAIVSFNNSASGAINIPSEIDLDGEDYTIKEIIRDAFINNQLTSVVIDEGIERIGLQAFINNQISSLSLPNSLQLIDFSAFQNNQLTNVTIPSNVTFINSNAFKINPITTVTFERATPPAPPAVIGGNISRRFPFSNPGNIALTVPIGSENAYEEAGWIGFGTVNGVANFSVGSRFVINNFNYTVTSIDPNEVEITGGNNIPQVLNIPASINNSGVDFSVTSVGESAFDNLQLTSVTIPNTVRSIRKIAFFKSQITSLTLPTNLRSIGELAFEQNQLTSVTIPNGVQTIANRAFRNNRIESIIIPNSVSSLGGQAFQNNRLESVTLSNAITTILQGTFDVNRITAVTIPEGVTSIGSRAFRSNRIENLTIPSSVATIVNEAFAGNPLATITAEGTNPASISEFTFGTNRANTQLFIPTNTESAYEAAGWTGFFSVNDQLLENAVGQTFTVDNLNYRVTAINPNTATITGGTTTETLSIPASVTRGTFSFQITQIGGNAFRNKNLTSVTIPNTITSIGSRAFDQNASLTAVTSLATTAPTIIENSFTARENIDLTVPDGSESDYAAKGWTGFFTVNNEPSVGGTFTEGAFTYRIIESNPNRVTIIGSTVSENVTIPSSVMIETFTFEVTAIAANVFRNKNVTSATIPSTITSIGARAFDQNANLTTVTSLAISAPTIEGNSFTGRNNINLSIPNGSETDYETKGWTGFFSVNDVPSIGTTFTENGFTFRIIESNPNRVAITRGTTTENLVIPPSVIKATFTFEITEIGTNAFRGKNLTSVTVPNTITSIGQRAFDQNTNLTAITSLATTAPTIVNSSFPNRGNINLTIPNGSISDYETKGWTGFLSVNDVPSIGTTFTKDEFTYRIIENSPNQVAITGGTTTENLTIPSSVVNQTFTFEVTEVGTNAFNGENLTSVTIPSTITSIGEKAFDRNATLISIEAEGTTPPTIENNSFGNRENIQLTIPEASVTAYENEGWTGFFSINGDGVAVGNTFSVASFRYEILSLAPNTVKAIGLSGNVPNGEFIFPEVLSINNIDFAITTIGNSAFRNRGVKSISLPSTLTTIEFRAFRDNRGFSKLTIPAGVTAISTEAFFDNGITEIVSESTSPPTIGAGTINPRNNIDLIIPPGTRQAYEDANWTGFRNIIENGSVIRVALKAFLQGATINPISGEENLMRDNLRVAGIIPITSPYEDALAVKDTIALFETTGPNAIVDWVFVELRDANDSSIVLEGKSALLQRDGDIVATDGVSPLSFASPLGEYFVSINHRNHLGILSSSALSLSTSISSVIDFTTDPSLTEAGITALTQVGEVFTSIAGDVNEDGQMLSTDITQVVTEIGTSGYRNTDLDMNGQILSTDIIIGNQNIGRGEQFSTTQIEEQIDE